MNKNTLEIVDGFIHDDAVYAVFKHLFHNKFNDFYNIISLKQIKQYMWGLLTSLEEIHSCGIVHRDVKPDNFLYNTNTEDFMLIDFGLAELIDNPKLRDDEEYMNIINLQRNGMKNRMGTRGFLAPETIFNYKLQSTGVDIWAAGIILLSFYSKRMPVLNMNKFSKLTNDTLKELYPLIIIYGIEKITMVANKYGSSLYIPDTFNDFILKDGLRTMVERNDIDSDGIDLLYKLLELDCDKRISAADAKRHRFFYDINK
jgi:cell division control protein 7